jgi:hypothetical protein
VQQQQQQNTSIKQKHKVALTVDSQSTTHSKQRHHAYFLLHQTKGTEDDESIIIISSTMSSNQHLMTKSQIELSNRIRKQKKSAYLSRKHGLADTINQTTSNENNNVEQFQLLFQSYCQMPSMYNLEQLNYALAGIMIFNSRENDNPLVILDQNDKTLAINFLNLLKNQVLTSSQ